jgi:hypothetical protein
MRIKNFIVAAAALSVCSLAATTASASVTLNFIEAANGSVHLTGSDNNGDPISATGSTADQFHLSSPIIPEGYTADATVGHIGISRSADDYLFALTERGGVSDYVWVHRLAGIFTVIDFVSDPTSVPGTPDRTVAENGALQFVGSYLNDRGELVSISVQSAAVPEPASWAMMLVGFGGLGAGLRARRRKQAFAAV